MCEARECSHGMRAAVHHQTADEQYLFFPFSSRADYFSTFLSSSLKFVLSANAKHKNQPITAD